jgi:hypothetical protein
MVCLNHDLLPAMDKFELSETVEVNSNIYSKNIFYGLLDKYENTV